MNHGERLTVTAGIILGIGFGGFVDGILFHQMLQWHAMVSSVIPPVDLVSAKVNMLYDGLFHVFCWTMTLIGVLVLAHAKGTERCVAVTKPLIASMFIGWGLFNVVEGLIDHQILGLHHVHPGAGQVAWDVGFLVLGVIFIVGGKMALSRMIRVPHLRPAY